MHTAERQAREERAQAVQVLKPLHRKLSGGQRLSIAERSAGDVALATIERCDAEIRIGEEARGLSADAGRWIGGSPSDSDDAETRAFSKYIKTGQVSPELRAAGDATGSAGGYLVPPGWWQRLQVALKAYGGTAADFQPLETETGQPMQWATVDPTAISASLIAENTQISDQDYTFGQGTLGAWMYTSGVQKVSFQLAADSAFNIDQFVEARVAESLGRKVAADAISGTGSSQPLGIITALAATSGMSSGGVYALGAGNKVNVLGNGTSFTTPTVQTTELLAGALNPTTVTQVIKTVDPAYRRLGAKFYMNDTQYQAHKLVSDGYGRPYWPELQDETNPRMNGFDVVVDQNIPSLVASTASGIIFGHLPSAMVMRTVQGAGLLRLEERYADFLQVGYIGYRRIDIRSNDLRAAVVVQPGGFLMTAEYRNAFAAYMRTGSVTPELRAAGEGGASDVTGAFLFPEAYQAQLAVALQAYGALFRDMQVVQTSHGRPLHVPTRAVKSAGTLLEENTQLSSDVDATYSESKLYAFAVTSGLNKFSLALEQDSGIPIESVIADWAAEAVGRKLSGLSVSGTGTVTDDGNGQPMGVITALAAASSAGTVGSAITATGGFVTMTAARALEVDGAATTELAANGLAPVTLRAMMKAVDPAYQDESCKWYFTQDQFNTLLGTTDTTGQPLIRPNGPRVLWGFPVVVAPELPALTLSTVGGPLFGNMSKAFYWRDAGFMVARQRERWADTGTFGVIGWGRYDLRVRDLRAIVTVKPAAT